MKMINDNILILMINNNWEMYLDHLNFLKKNLLKIKYNQLMNHQKKISKIL